MAVVKIFEMISVKTFWMTLFLREKIWVYSVLNHLLSVCIVEYWHADISKRWQNWFLKICCLFKDIKWFLQFLSLPINITCWNCIILFLFWQTVVTAWLRFVVLGMLLTLVCLSVHQQHTQKRTIFIMNILWFEYTSFCHFEVWIYSQSLLRPRM